MKQELLKWIDENKIGRPSVYGLGTVETVYMDDLIEMINELDEPQITDEQAWNKIAEAYPETDQSLRITLDHAVFGHMNKEKKIPQIIAKYLELCKSDNFDFTEDYNLVSYDFINHFDTDLTIEEMEEIKMWFYDNDQKENQRRHILFLQAYTYGYEVEEEPKYEVVFREDADDRFLLMQLNEHIYEIAPESENDGYRSQWFTEQEIKSIDERYWKFAVAVEKVEE